MSRVITFSRYFPATHPKKGRPTFFVEKLAKGFPEYSANDFTCLKERPNEDIFSLLPLAIDLWSGFAPKYHTIRAGNRWKVGDKFSPRVWSGKPYASKQIIIAPDIEIKKIWAVEIMHDFTWFSITINGNEFPAERWETLAKNDGLSTIDFMDWFKKGGNIFTGQIICWNDSIEYS